MLMTRLRHEKGVLADCFAAQNFLCDRYGIQPTDIILFGRSLGGGCAVAVASRKGAAGLRARSHIRLCCERCRSAVIRLCRFGT